MVVSHRLTLAADKVFDCSVESGGSCFGGHRKGADAVVVLQGKKAVAFRTGQSIPYSKYSGIIRKSFLLFLKECNFGTPSQQLKILRDWGGI